MSAFDIPANLNPREYVYDVDLDNYSPARTFQWDEPIVAYDLHESQRNPAHAIHAHPFKDGPQSVFLLDYGHVVVPYYVATYSLENDYLILYPFPTDAETTRIRKFAKWQVGPRKAYHLKIRKTENGEEDNNRNNYGG